MQNPQTAMQHMFGNDPKFQQAMKMAQGKTPDQLKETALNLAKTQGSVLSWHSKVLKWFLFMT